MTIALVDGAAYAASVLAPATGDAATQAVFSAGLQNLADRTNYLYQQSKKGGTGVPAGVPKVTSEAALAAITTPVQGDMAVLYDPTGGRGNGVYVFVGSLPRGASSLSPEYIVGTGGTTGAWVLCGIGEGDYVGNRQVGGPWATAQVGTTVGAAAGVGSEVTLTVPAYVYTTARIGDQIEYFADIGFTEFVNTSSVTYVVTLSVNNAGVVTDSATAITAPPRTAGQYTIVPFKTRLTATATGVTSFAVRCYWNGAFSGTRAVVNVNYLTASVYR